MPILPKTDMPHSIENSEKLKAKMQLYLRLDIAIQISQIVGRL